MNEIPYWETINRYLEKLDPDGLQDIICRLCERLIRGRAFEDARIRGKYWQVIIDGTQLRSSRGELDDKCLYRVHNKGTPEEYKESYYYVLEAKLVLRPGILVSIMTEFVENSGCGKMEKQDCERKACWRLMGRLKKEFPKLPVCISADSSRIYHFLLFAFQLNCITFFDFGIRIKYTAFFFWAAFCISPNFNHIDSTLLINFLKTFHF